MDRRMGKWLYYKFAAGTGSFHTKKLCSSLYSIEIKFYFFKTKKSIFWAIIRGLRGNVPTPSIARWKARDQLLSRHNWTFFAIFYGWDVVSGNLSKSAFFEGGESLWVQILDGRGRRPPTTVGVRKLESLYTVHYLVLSQSTRVTDARADRQTELRLPRPR